MEQFPWECRKMFGCGSFEPECLQSNMLREQVYLINLKSRINELQWSTTYEFFFFAFRVNLIIKQFPLSVEQSEYIHMSIVIHASMWWNYSEVLMEVWMTFYQNKYLWWWNFMLSFNWNTLDTNFIIKFVSSIFVIKLYRKKYSVDLIKCDFVSC